MLLSDAVSGYLLFKSTRASPRTIETDTFSLSQFETFIGSDVDVCDITSENVRDYLAHHRERGLSQFTVKRHLAVVSAMYTWLVGADVTETDPTDAVPNPKLPKVQPKALSKDDIGGLVDATRQSHNPRRDKAIVLFLLDTGARASELCGVEVSDVHMNDGKVLLRDTKGSKERFVYLGKRALSALFLYTKDERPEPARVGCERLFLNQEGYSMSRHTLRSIIRRLAERAGIEATTHQLRHSSAVSHLQHGMDVASLQRMLGHSQLSTTAEYLNSLRDETVREKAQRTSPSDNWRL